MSLPLLKACSGVLDHSEKKVSTPVLHVSFVGKEQTAQLDGLYAGKGLQRPMEKTNSCAC